MSSVPISEGSIAERRAADVSLGRQKLDNGRTVLDRYRANELAEAEALSLARIKADTERALAHQAQTLRDAERAAELVAIERRSTDLEAIKEAQRRQTLDAEAEAAAAAHTIADQLAATAAQERQSAIAAAQEKNLRRLEQEREALRAKAGNRSAQLRLAWIQLRTQSPILVGVIALLIGSGSTWLAVTIQNKASLFAHQGEASLKLERELLSASSLVQTQTPPTRPSRN